ncbi:MULTISPECIES: PEP-CTERM sorting domain-containing protein [unclassified Colwellia]|uniref:PEP-CTERM sorting domain-containing protein n=2 Tax=Colwellia TaxID=28228 RepID=UPI00217513E2|nr:MULTISPECIES: PEP-CTERM sorting domain-containing protein [unclassified Colwellia]
MKFKFRNQILAVFYAITMFITGGANAGLITIDAVKHNIGSVISFDEFDDTLGTLRNVKLHYSLSMWLRIVNDCCDIAADEWNAAVEVSIDDFMTYEALGVKTYDVATFDIVESGGSVVMYEFTISDVMDIAPATGVVGIQWIYVRIFGSGADAMFRGLSGGDAYCEDDYHCIGGGFSSVRLEYQYETFATTTQTNVPEPSTLAIFALGMMGLVSRRFKK